MLDPPLAEQIGETLRLLDGNRTDEDGLPALIEPVDNIKYDTVAQIPGLLAYLEKTMKELDYNLKDFLRVPHITFKDDPNWVAPLNMVVLDVVFGVRNGGAAAPGRSLVRGAAAPRAPAQRAEAARGPVSPRRRPGARWPPRRCRRPDPGSRGATPRRRAFDL